MNPSATLAKGKQNISILISSTGPPVDFAPDEALYARLSSLEKLHFITNVFIRPGAGHGYFEDLYAGDLDLLKILAVKTHVGTVLLGHLNYTIRKSASVSNDLVCEIAFNYKVVEPVTDTMRTDRFIVSYASFAEANALRGAIDALGPKLAERLSKIF